jgi:hypothetical protein
MEQAQIDLVAGVLQRWNPLGAGAARVPDLDGYETEAIDIIFNLSLGRQTPESVVRTVLNQAFGLNLTPEECSAPATEIAAAVNTEGKRGK